MSADQTAGRRPAPITQRDGSELASSNCRMASIATGLDYDTVGAKTSTGAKMRTYTTDQEGGTDSGDAKQAWDRGYGENLDIQDGNGWADVLADLQRGRLVHLDVWHATVGGPCLSGSGQYGHTMAVLPDCKGDEWLVADPWCSPAKWVRVPEAKLRAGAEKWANQVYGTARQTHGPGEPSREQLRRIVRELLNRWTPGGRERVGSPPDLDTGGAVRVMYTATTPQPLKPPPSTGGTDVGIVFDPRRWTDKGTPLYLDPDFTTLVTTTQAGGTVTSLGWAAKQDDNGFDSSKVAIRASTAKLAGSGATVRAFLWAKRADLGAQAGPTSAAWADSIWALMADDAGRYPCPPGQDCGEAVAVAVGQRDDTWEAALMNGRPWPTIETAGPEEAP